MSDVVRFWTNPDVMCVQSRLYSPGYGGPARWVIFEPRARKAFSALGKDVTPDALLILVAASRGARRSELLNAHPGITAAHLDSLAALGLLQATPNESAPTSFLNSFHKANIDYPFFDYGSANVVEDEARLLEHYAKLWPAPSPTASRDGVRFDLPLVGDRPPQTGGVAQLSIQSLAWMLRTALTPIGRIRTRYVNCIQRTTPSGGARHPTELVVVLDKSLGLVPPGTYAYDSETHTLVTERSEIHDTYRQALRDEVFGIIVRSRVERAMWRYRDLRALRPLLIDAGHLAEMAIFLLRRLGVGCNIFSPPTAPFASSWLEEPEIALILPQPKDSAIDAQAFAFAGSSSSAHSQAQDDGVLVTNPALFMRFDGSIVVNTLWPERKQLAAGQTEFLVLNHCLPSTRGDRDTSVDGIRAAVPSCTSEMIKRLQAARALLPVADAHLLYKGSRIWIRHEWYLALLSYLESIADGQSASTRSALDADGSYIEDISTLYRRRTVRTFSDGSVSVEALKNLLGRSLSGIPSDNWTVSIMPRNVEGLDDLLYRWQEGGLIPIGQPISPAVVAKMSAGQTAASAGALTVWLSRLTDIGMPAQYVMDLIDLGRLGQRICEVATEMGLAVFLTPAVYDRDTCNHLNLKQADSMLTYLFSVGVPHSEPSTAVHEDVRRP